ncbi:S-methyl-5-thioribose-1-phosphate isomerase, partial [Mortierella sp. GBA35]
MAANQHTATQLVVSIPLAPGSSSATAAARYPAPEPQEAPVPAPPIVVAGSTPVSTPTSGMHSPPLSGTLEEEANEKRTAHRVASISQSQEFGPGGTTASSLTFKTPPSTTLSQATATTNRNNVRSASSSRPKGEEGRDSPSVTAPTQSTTSQAKPDFKITRANDQPDTEMNAAGGSGVDLKSRDSHPSIHSSGSRTGVNLRPDLHQVRRPQSKEKTIEHVLQQGKILKLSRRLRTRLEYAILKIRRGWTKYTLQEVESLTQPVCSPRITPRQIHQSISLQSSPLLTERKRAKRTTHQRRLSDPARIERFPDPDVVMQHAQPSSPPPERFRPRMPSLSQFKDSELFLPAKSLMEIATSKPEPGYLSPFLGSQASPYQQHLTSSAHSSPQHSRYGTPEPLYRDTTPVRDTSSRNNWSGYSSPARGGPMEVDEQDENGVPSAAQAARTILMLSSPTRPAPRTLSQNYIVEMHSGSPTHSPLGEWVAPYSPMTSSPLVQFQTMDDSTTPSPDRTPTMSGLSTPGHLTDKERGASPSSSSTSSSHQRGSSYTSFRPSKQTYANFYEPSSPSPLSSSLFPSSSSSSDHLDRFKTTSRSSSPTLKRAVRFAAAATQGSLDSSALSVDRIKDKIAGLSGRGEYNSTADMIYPGSQPGHDDKKEYSPAPSYSSPSGSQYAGDQGQSVAYGDAYAHRQHQQDTTPPPQLAPSTLYNMSSSSIPGSAYNNSSNSDINVDEARQWDGAGRGDQRLDDFAPTRRSFLLILISPWLVYASTLGVLTVILIFILLTNTMTGATLQAIRYQRGSLEIIDQLLLPHETLYIPISTLALGHDAIKTMKVRGAPAIAIVAALTLAVVLVDSKSVASGRLSTAQDAVAFIEESLEFLKTSRPTAVNLFDAAHKLAKGVREAGAAASASGQDVVSKYLELAEKMLEEDVKDNMNIGRFGAEFILKVWKGGDDLRVITHCNTGSLATAGYGTALGIIRALAGQQKLTHAYCTETRPYNQGSRLTAYELVYEKIPSTLITDSMASALLVQNPDKIAAIVVGAD